MYKFKSEVFARFSNANCDSLRNVPKIFVIQGCRGPISDTGVAVDHKSTDQTEQYYRTYDPQYSHFFILYSCPPHFKALRNESDGSWLIKAFVEEMSKYAHCEEWKDICTRISNHVGTKQGYLESTKGWNSVAKQSVEVVVRGPNKRLYFNK